VTDWLSIGAGPAITYATLDWNLEAATGTVKARDADDTKVAALVGVLLAPRPDLRLGITYASKTDLELGGSTRGPMGVNPNFEIELPLPQTVKADLYWDVTERIALMIGGDWEDWSDAQSVPLSLGSISGNAPLGFKDTWKARIGGRYRLNDDWGLETGFSYDSSPVRTKDRIAALPLDRQIRVGAGALYEWSQDTRVGFGFQWLSFGEANLRNNAVRGNYDWNDAFFVFVNVNWSKLPWSGRATF
jgi:long-chain fatty acid transport protein